MHAENIQEMQAPTETAPADNLQTAPVSTESAPSTATEKDPIDLTEKVQPPQETKAPDSPTKGLFGDRARINKPTAKGGLEPQGEAEKVLMSKANAELAADKYIAFFSKTLGFCGAMLSGGKAEDYELDKAEKTEYKKHTVNFFLTLNDFGSPGFWFAISTVGILFSVGVRAYREGKAKRAADVQKATAPAPTTRNQPAATATKNQDLELCHEAQTDRANYETTYIGGELFYKSNHQKKDYKLSKEKRESYPKDFQKPSPQFEKLIRECGLIEDANLKTYGEAVEYAQNTAPACRSLRDAIQRANNYTQQDVKNFLIQCNLVP